MKHYLKRFAKEYDRAQEFLCVPDIELRLKKITGKLIPGSRCAWYYDDDLAHWKFQKMRVPHPDQWPYSGYIIPLPNTNGRGEMQVEETCLVVVDYPIEKENPETDWCVLALLFERDDLQRFHIYK